VDSLASDEIRRLRGTLTEPGTESPYRGRAVEENLDLFARMRAGEFEDGAHVLRARIDMGSPNINMRDPVLYRIRRAHHYRTGDTWCIYPMYDFAHPPSDAIEQVTHSLCTLEFEDHRPLYDWLIAHLPVPAAPRQIEFARLNLTYTVMSKRKLLQLVEQKFVSGWDDPRMPTISAYRRRGYTPESIRAFCKHIGMNKFDSRIEHSVLDNFLREDLNKRAPRRLAVLRPLKVVIDNYGEAASDELDAINNPEDASAGTRKVPFGRVIYIEQDDFREMPPPKYFRLAPGVEVRLRYAYFIKCTSVVKDAQGAVTEVHCTYDPATRGGDAPDGRKVKGTIHWVSAEHALDAEVRLYDFLFAEEEPQPVPEGQDPRSSINPRSLEVVTNAKLEPALRNAAVGEKFQFERLGYFCVDKDSAPGKLVFNRTVTLKDTWAKEEKKGKK